MADAELGLQVQSSPMSRLHPDVLGEIFGQCDGIYTIYIEDPRPPLHYTLSKVCIKWRETVQGRPSLWRKFGINFNDEAMENEENLEIHTRRLDTCLRLSGDLGLQLELRYNATKFGHSVPPFLEIAAKMLGERSDRWVSLNVRPFTPAFLSILGTKAVKGLTRLRSLQADFINIEGPLDACLPWCDAPRLQTVTLSHTTMNDRVQPHLKHVIPWWQITKICLMEVTTPYRELRQLLDRTPGLRELEARMCELQGVTKKITPVHLEHLVYLTFVPPVSFNFNFHSPGSGLPMMFDLLHCPNLVYLSAWPSPLTTFMGKGAAAHDILDFIHRTGCKLKALDIGMTQIDDVEILLQEIPSLYSISCTQADDKGNFLGRLAKVLTPTFTLDGMYIPAPRLQNIFFTHKVAGAPSAKALEGVREQLDALVEALEHRVKGSPSLPVYGLRRMSSVNLFESRVRIRNCEMPKIKIGRAHV